MSEQGHNSGGQQLRAFIERIERVEEEIKALNADKSEIYKEARDTGFDVKTMRKVVAARKMDVADREEADALFDMYMSALGEVPKDEPRARAHAREKIEEIPLPTSSPEAELPEPYPPAEASAGVEPPPSAPAEEFTPPTFLAKKTVLRPDCLDPEKCAGYGTHQCHRCTVAASTPTDMAVAS